MELTGKCKEDFEKYLKYAYIIDGKIESLDLFYFLPQSMQYGVYVDFFSYSKIDIIKFFYDFYRKDDYTIEMSRTKAIEKANEIYNEKI